MSPPSSAVSGPSATPGGSSGESRYPKLDGVLYHFYSKTSAVITSTRLTHFEANEGGMAGSSSTSSRTQQLRRTASDSYGGGTPIGTPVRGSSSGGGGKKPSKWFALEIDDHDVFRDEVRLWRNVSPMLPDPVLNGEALPDPAESYVPSLMLDVILDTSQLSAKHVLMIDEAADQDGRAKRRVRVDGLDGDATSTRPEDNQARTDAPLDTHRQSIVLESWKLDFRPDRPAAPPELPVLYKQATAHFREVYAKITTVPAYNLHQRLKQGWQAALERQRVRTESGQNTDEVGDPEEEASSLLKIGVRLAIGQSATLDEGQVAIDEPLPYQRQRGLRASSELTERLAFDPVISPIGNLCFSVEYRKNVDFYVEDWHVMQSMQEVALDEDYFKPTMTRYLQKRPSSQRSGSSSNSPTPHLVALPPVDRTKSLLSVTSRQANDGTTPLDPAPTSPMDVIPNRGVPSANNAFGSTAQTVNRPVAGLSSLRANPPISTFSASPSAAVVFGHGTTSGSGAASPALSSVLSSDAAFLTHARRSSSSASDRKAKAMVQTASADNQSAAQSQSSTQTSTSVGRPILTRASVSAFSRSGSYSPSSPSPLAQQMWAQQSAALAQVNAQNASRLSSSPSFRAGGGFAASISPSLRSVFQTYTPSQSQTSVSSLSRTPPRSLLDAGHGAGNVESSGSPNVQGSLSSPRQPTVGPQMIKRYSSTFRYRHGKQDGSTGSDGGASSGSGTGAGVYSKSWQARIEQRQGFAGRSLERASYSASSPLAARQSLYAAASAEPEEDLDDLVRMLDSRPDLRQIADSQSIGAGSGDLSRQRHADQANYFTHDHGLQTGSAGALPSDQEQDMLSMTGIGAASATSFPRAGGYKRSQIDEMLTKMQNSMRDLSTSMATNRSSPASGGAATSSSGPQSQPEHSSSFYAGGGRSPATMRSPLSRETSARPPTGVAPHMEAILSGDGLSAESSTRLDGSSSDAVQGGSKGRSDAESGRRTRYGDVEDDDDAAADGVRDSRDESRMSRSHPGRTTSRGSLELYGGTVHSYDPLEDETAGRLELASDEQESKDDSGTGVVVGGGGGAGGNGTGNVYCPPGLHPRGHVMRSTSAGPLSTAMDEAGSGASVNVGATGGLGSHQRQTNYELARNFRGASNGRSSAAITSGARANVSPWRVRQYHVAAESTGANAAGHGPQTAPQYRHGRLINAGNHVVGPGGGTRSGPTSAGPTSRANSPLLSD